MNSNTYFRGTWRGKGKREEHYTDDDYDCCSRQLRQENPTVSTSGCESTGLREGGGSLGFTQQPVAAQHAEASEENKQVSRHTRLGSEHPKPPDNTNYRRGVE